ncbi:Uncharacterized protein BM_BM7198 [Brugia malayi]|uniref:Acid phosphatase n=2 Tax=Brugia TaxID=6278 RepID=A0A0J9XSJ4_BRUMA|nr:Uncharacterized protein BM_BM7198 [Brugia malayi]CDP94972.1 Bm7198 [Brugia malayi]VIO87110.1 Uncharacterized protein BM_BM7198 [Brugia malayi]
MTNAGCGKKRKSALFVCLGNICRSPMAEGICLDLIKKKGLEDKWIVDSAAVASFHIGKSPDKRAMATLARHGIKDYEHKVRQVTDSDFRDFDYIFGMDEENIE